MALFLEAKTELLNLQCKLPLANNVRLGRLFLEYHLVCFNTHTATSEMVKAATIITGSIHFILGPVEIKNS